jgi:glycine cleavage system aminomethyltransferase T
VTSAGYGFAVEQSIVYGYVPVELAQPGTKLAVEYFGVAHPATVAADPLYDPERTRLTI